MAEKKRPYEAPKMIGAMVTQRHRQLAMRAIRGERKFTPADYEWIENPLLFESEAWASDFWRQNKRIAQAIADAEGADLHLRLYRQFANNTPYELDIHADFARHVHEPHTLELTISISVPQKDTEQSCPETDCK